MKHAKKNLREDSLADKAIGQNEETVDNLLNFILQNHELMEYAATPIRKVLMKRMLKQTYDPDMAVKYWLNLVDMGVKKYQQELNDSTPMFDKPVRVQVASKLAKDFETKVNSGAIRVRDVFGVEGLQEIAAGAGVGVGVLGQEKEEEEGEESGEEGEGSEGESETAPEKPEKEETTSEGLMKSKKLLESLIDSLVTEALVHTKGFAGGTILNTYEWVMQNYRAMWTDPPDLLAMKLSQEHGLHNTPNDLRKALAEFKQDLIERDGKASPSYVKAFKELLLKSSKSTFWS